MSKTHYQVICVYQKEWRMFVEQAFSCLSENELRLAETILTTLHDQHIGITPLLIVSLVKTFWPADKNSLSGMGQATAQSPWTEVSECLARVATPLDKVNPNYIQAERTHLIYLLRQSPLYTVTRLIAPLITYACQHIGVCYLFSHQNEHILRNAKKYEEYHDNLVAAIQYIAQEQKSEANPYELFWQDIASMLTQKPVMNFSLPEADPPTAALFYRLNELPEWTDDQTLRRLHTLITPLRTRHRQEAGVRGIRVSRRLEDIHDILLSEFVNPEPLLLDRLLNSGYLVFEREPKREKLRDMLLMGIMPHCVRQQGNVESKQSELSADFAKVCWFNLAAHLGLLLRRYNLWQSEFRWIEGDAWQRVHIESRLLFQLEEDKHRVSDIILDKIPDTRHQRQHFLQQMNWLPNYLDTRARYQPLKGWNDPSGNDENMEVREEEGQSSEKQQLDELVGWVRQVKAQQLDSLDWLKSQAKSRRRQAAQVRPQKLAVDDFTFVHIVVFLPAINHEKWGGEARGMLNLATQIGRNDPHHNLSVVWTPPLIMSPLGRSDDPKGAKENPSGWMYAAPYYPDRTPFDRAHSSDPVEMANALVKTWLNEIIQEIKHA